MEQPIISDLAPASPPVGFRSLLNRARSSDFIKHGMLIFVASMLVNIAGYVYHAGTSRLLGVQDYGALYALIALLPLLGIPAAILSTVIVKFAAEFRALNDDAHIHALVSRVVLWLGLGSAVLLAAGILFSGPISEFLKVPRASIVPTAVLIGVVILLPTLRAVLQGTQDFWQFSISAVLEGVLKAGLGIGLALLGFGLLGALGGYALGSLASLLYTWFVLQRRYGRTHSEPLHIGWARLLQTVAGAAVLTITVNALSYGDVLIVKHFMSPIEAGLYASVSLGGKILLFVSGFVPMVLLPKAAHRATNKQSPFPIFLMSLGTLAMFSGVGLALFYFVPSLILRSLVGGQFASAAHLLFAYGLAMSLMAGMGLVANYKIALHRFDFTIPFALVTIGELTTIAVRHPNLEAVIWTLVIGNALGFLASLFRIHVWQPRLAL